MYDENLFCESPAATRLDCGAMKYMPLGISVSIRDGWQYAFLEDQMSGVRIGILIKLIKCGRFLF